MKKSSKKRSVKPEINWPKQVYADISTMHIREVDGMRLFVPGCPRVIAEAKDGSGHFLYISDWEPQEIKQAKFTLDFVVLIKRLQQAGFTHLRLDADAPIVEGLPQYPW